MKTPYQPQPEIEHLTLEQWERVHGPIHELENAICNIVEGFNGRMEPGWFFTEGSEMHDAVKAFARRDRRAFITAAHALANSLHWWATDTDDRYAREYKGEVEVVERVSGRHIEAITDAKHEASSARWRIERNEAPVSVLEEHRRLRKAEAALTSAKLEFADDLLTKMGVIDTP